MHDVTKRGLALAVATGGLLITGAAPALSAVSPHPERPDATGTKSHQHDGSSLQAAHQAAIPVSGSTVKQDGAHEAAKGRHAAPHRDATPNPATCAPTPPAPGTCGPAPAPAPPPAPASSPAPPVMPPPLVPAPAPAPTSAPAPAAAPAGGGLLTNNTVELPIHAPLNLCGVALTIIGSGNGATGDSCVNGPNVAGGPSSSATTAQSAGGVLSDNIVQVPVSIPANVCGDTVTAVGSGNQAQNILCANDGPASSATANASTANASGVGNANIVQVPVNVPVNVCGITANLVAAGNKAVGDTCVNGASVPASAAAPAGSSASASTSGTSGVATGNVVQAPITAPVDLCGDTLNVLGADNPALGNMCVNNAPGGSSASASASGGNGVASGNVAQVPINIPAEVCGIVAGVLAAQNQAAGNVCANETGGAPTATSSANTTGQTGIVAGTVVQGGVNIPVQVCGISAGAGMTSSPSTGNSCATGSSPATAPVPAPPPALACPPPAAPAPPPVLPPPPPPVEAPPSAPQPGMTTPTPLAPIPNTPSAPAPSSDTPSAPLEPSVSPLLPHTGADVLGLAGVGAGALLVGAGAMVAARRKSGSAS